MGVLVVVGADAVRVAAATVKTTPIVAIDMHHDRIIGNQAHCINVVIEVAFVFGVADERDALLLARFLYVLRN